MYPINFLDFNKKGDSNNPTNSSTSDPSTIKFKLQSNSGNVANRNSDAIETYDENFDGKIFMPRSFKNSSKAELEAVREIIIKNINIINNTKIILSILVILVIGKKNINKNLFKEESN